MEKFLALADRVEALTGPDRDIDTEILWHVDRRRFSVGYWNAATGLSRPLEQMPSKNGGLGWIGAQCSAPAYTASLDAAMMLMPDDPWIEIKGPRKYLNIPSPVPNYWSASISQWNHESEGMGWGATPALAVVAAALRARARLTPPARGTDGGGE